MLSEFCEIFKCSFIIGLFYAILSSSWAMLAGQVGIISFAQAAFTAVGAFTSAILVIRLQVPIAVGILAGAGSAAVFGFLIGALTLRMRGCCQKLASIGDAIAATFEPNILVVIFSKTFQAKSMLNLIAH